MVKQTWLCFLFLKNLTKYEILDFMLGSLVFSSSGPYHKEISSSITFENSPLICRLLRLGSWVFHLLALWLFSPSKDGGEYLLPRMLWGLKEKIQFSFYQILICECYVVPKGFCCVFLQIVVLMKNSGSSQAMLCSSAENTCVSEFESGSGNT